MKRSSFISLTILIFVLILTSCATPAQEEPPAEIPVESSYPVDYEYLRTPSARYYCENTWVNSNELKYAGFGHKETVLEEKRDGEFVEQRIRVTLKTININDRIVDVTDWTVVQVVEDSEGNTTLTQELDREPWIEEAKNLMKRAPDLELYAIQKWDRYNGYWDMYEYKCSEIKK